MRCTSCEMISAPREEHLRIATRVNTVLNFQVISVFCSESISAPREAFNHRYLELKLGSN